MRATQDGRRRGAQAVAIIVAALVCGQALWGGQRVAAQRAVGFSDMGAVTFTGDGSPADLDPINNQTEYGSTVIRNIEEPLVRLGSPSFDRFVPVLATSWGANADQSVWTFHLRHGVRFHSGRCCLTATDVQYSLGRSVAANLAASYMLARFMANPFKQIKILDPYTVRFDLGRPQPFFINALAQDEYLPILDAQLVEAHAEGKDYGHAWLSRHDAGTGPYTLQSWTPGQQVVLTRFPAYWGGWAGPHFSKAIMTDVPSAETRRELVERGQADITFDLTPQDLRAMQSNPTLRIVAPYATEIVYMIMTEAGPLASPAARQALSYAFNYDALIKGIYGGYARRSYGPIPSTVLGYDPRAFHYETDLVKAKALLQQAGVVPGTTLTYAYSDIFPNKEMGLILQAQLAQIGVTLVLQELSTAAYNNVLYGNEPASKRPNLLSNSWWPDYNDPYDMANPLVNSAQTPPGGSNGGFYRNKAVDALLARMATDSRSAIVADAATLQDITGRQDPPAIWAAEPAQATVVASALRGFALNPVQLRTFYFYSMYR